MTDGDRHYYQAQVDVRAESIADCLELEHKLRGVLTDSGTVQLYWAGKYGSPIGQPIALAALDNLSDIVYDLAAMRQEETAHA